MRLFLRQHPRSVRFYFEALRRSVRFYFEALLRGEKIPLGFICNIMLEFAALSVILFRAYTL